MNRMVIGIISLLALGACTSASAADIDWSKIDQAIGKKGSEQPGGVHKYGLPRSDLQVTVDGVATNRRWRSARGSLFNPQAMVPCSWATWC